MYKIWVTQGQGGRVKAECETLDEALAIANKGIEAKDGSFAIEYPDGKFHQWSDK